MSEDTDKTTIKRREARLRRVAAVLGLKLQKSRARDTSRMDYGLYRIVRPESDYVVAGRFPYGYSLTLDAVEGVLDELLEEEDHKAVQQQWMAVHGRAGELDAKWG
ncbi:MAG: hypothetical protein GXY46_06890 [Actinobacteria bacterium]|nr:hypothetical protein [Actinomycetota bacterium]